MPFGSLKRLVGLDPERAARALQPVVGAINALEPEIRALSDTELMGQTEGFRERLAAGDSHADLLPEAFATVREAVRRETGERQFDVQLIGGMVLHQGDIAEMRTGEGKTSVATLPAYLNALDGRGVHIITVNDYLANRDANWYGRALTDRLGLGIGVIQHNQPTEERRAAYRADITYGTNNEFGFDYLRDNMVHDLADRVHRDLHYAIIDEVDNILIDEARTPLIISGDADESTDLYYKFADLVKRLDAVTDYTVDLKLRSVSLTEDGIAKVERALGVDNLYDELVYQQVHYLEQALRAHVVYERGRDYVLFMNDQVIDRPDRRAQVVIVDEFTGRLMHGRRFGEGLHQAIEAKERVAVQRESRTLATVTFQNYFRMYDKLAGMTGTAKTEEQEFQTIYGLDVVVIPTHQPMVRSDQADVVYQTSDARDRAAVNAIAEGHTAGRPALVGTTSIERSEHLSHLLRQRKIPHSVLNAKYHAQEAEIIAEAGRVGAVTIATNMAGRGTDIILGGRPGDRTQIEWQQEHDQVVELGGLHVMGTERHEARRIDNQLRGRSGRQGDPGSSQFFVSLEDDLMRRFAADRIQGLMERLGVDENEPIESNMVSRAIESAQTKVEAHNYDIRKYVLEFDNVVNQQRSIIYEQRERILRSEDLDVLLLDMLGREIKQLVEAHSISPQSENPEIQEVLTSYGTLVGANEEPVAVTELVGLQAKAVTEVLTADAEKHSAAKRTDVGPELADQLMRWIMLQTTDYLWVEHLTAIEDVRQGIGLRAYGQQDPLVAFKREGFAMFEQLTASIQAEIVRRSFQVQWQQAVPRETVLSRQRTAAVGKLSDTAGSLTEPSVPLHEGGQTPQMSRRERRAMDRKNRKKTKRHQRSQK